MILLFNKEHDLLDDLERGEEDTNQILSELDRILEEKESSILALQGLFEKFSEGIQNEKKLSLKISNHRKNAKSSYKYD